MFTFFHHLIITETLSIYCKVYVVSKSLLMAKLTQAPCVTNGLNLKNLQLFCDTKISTRKSKVSPFASSLSQPCLQNQGPGRVLPFLYLGSQEDALNADTMRDHNITYVLNVTASCPKADFIQESHFMRISVNDSHNEQLIPYFKQAFDFLGAYLVWLINHESGFFIFVHLSH